MTKYDIIFEELQYKVNSGELAVEDAQILNDLAYEKYSEESVTYDQYLESMEEELFGEATRYKEEQEKLAKKINAEQKNIKKYEKRDNEIESIAADLRRKKKFILHSK